MKALRISTKHSLKSNLFHNLNQTHEYDELTIDTQLKRTRSVQPSFLVVSSIEL